MKTASHTPPSIVTEAATFIGIDYHKKYSVWHAVDAAGCDLGKGRIEHHSPDDFATLVKRFASTRMGNGVRVQLLDKSMGFRQGSAWHAVFAFNPPGPFTT